MARRKIDPLERAFQAFVELDAAQQEQFHAMVIGYRRGAWGGPQASAPERKPREKKPAAPLFDKAVAE